MASFLFFAGEDANINNLAGSGLGFYGADFGFSVPVGEYQDTTFITDSNGTIQGLQADNVKYQNIGSGIVGSSSSGIPLISIPNYQATLNVRFNHSSAIKTQNGKVRIYDRSDINNDPSGVTCQVAEIIHPNTTQFPTGSGDSDWTDVHGSAVILDIVSSPGHSGLSPNGPDTTDLNHDWYLALSASPDSIGSKTQFGLYISLEYY